MRPPRSSRVTDAHLTVLGVMPAGAWLTADDVAAALVGAGHGVTRPAGVPSWDGRPLTALLRGLRRVGWVRSSRGDTTPRWQRVHDGDARN